MDLETDSPSATSAQLQPARADRGDVVRASSASSARSTLCSRYRCHRRSSRDFPIVIRHSKTGLPLPPRYVKPCSSRAEERFYGHVLTANLTPSCDVCASASVRMRKNLFGSAKRKRSADTMQWVAALLSELGIRAIGSLASTRPRPFLTGRRFASRSRASKVPASSRRYSTLPRTRASRSTGCPRAAAPGCCGPASCAPWRTPVHDAGVGSPVHRPAERYCIGAHPLVERRVGAGVQVRGTRQQLGYALQDVLRAAGRASGPSSSPTWACSSRALRRRRNAATCRKASS